MTDEGAIIFVPLNELVDTHTGYMYRVYFDPGFYIDVQYDQMVRKQKYNKVYWEYIDKIEPGDYLEFIQSHNYRYFSKRFNSHRNKYVGYSMLDMFNKAQKEMRHIKIDIKKDYAYNKTMKKIVNIYRYMSKYAYFYYVPMIKQYGPDDRVLNNRILLYYQSGLIGKHVSGYQMYLIFEDSLINQYNKKHNIKEKFIYTLSQHSLYNKFWDSSLLDYCPPVITHNGDRVITYPKNTNITNLNLYPYLRIWEDVKLFMLNKRMQVRVSYIKKINKNVVDQVHPIHPIELPGGLITKRHIFIE